MPESPAEPDDVRVEYGTILEDDEIDPYIDRAARRNERHNNVEAMDESHRRDLEAALAALWVATRSKDRAEEQTSSGRSSLVYEESVVERLEQTIESLDPSNELIEEIRGSFEVF